MLVLIQARMNSKRLPKKVLFKINNKEILLHIITKLKKCKRKINLVVATSNSKHDLPIVQFCKKNKIKFYRGDLEDVSLRLLKAAKKFKSKYFIRICGDSPLVDSSIIDKMIKISKQKTKFDLISNREDKSIPPGQTVEIIKTRTLEKSYKLFFLKRHYEHVTKYFYENKKKFLIFKTSLFKEKTSLKLTIDTKKDFEKMKFIIEKLSNFKNLRLKQIQKVYKKLGYV